MALTAQIRQYLAEHPEASVEDIAEAIGEHKTRVEIGLMEIALEDESSPEDEEE